MSVRLIVTPELCYFVCTSMSRVKKHWNVGNSQFFNWISWFSFV